MHYLNWIVLSKNIMHYLFILSALHWRYSFAIEDNKLTATTNKTNNQGRFFTDAEFQVPTDNKLTSATFMSPFNVNAFNQQLVPLIGASVKNNIQMLVHGMDKGVAVMKNAVKAQFQHITQTKRHIRNHFRHKPIPMLHAAPSMVQYRTYGKPQQIYKPMLKKKYSVKSTATAANKTTQKPETKYKYDKTGKIVEAFPPKDIERGGKSGKMEFNEYKNLENDMGIDVYKHFEDSVIRDLEKKEEKNVEATMHSKLNKEEVITGKQYAYESGWIPVTTTTPTGNRQPAPKSPTTTKNGKPKDKYVGNESKQTNNYKPAATTTKAKPLSHQKQKALRKNVKKQESKHVVKHLPIITTSATTITTIRPTKFIPQKIDPKLFSNAPTDSDSTLQPDYLQNIFFAKNNHTLDFQHKAEATPSTRNHVQSLTTRKPNLTYLKSNSLVAQATSHSKSVLATQKPKRKLNNLAYASQAPSVAPSVRPTSKFVDRPKQTGLRGSVKFGDKLNQP